MAPFGIILFYFFALFESGLGARELLKNHDMEVVHLNGNWACNGACTLVSDRDHYSGYHSIKVTNRYMV